MTVSCPHCGHIGRSLRPGTVYICSSCENSFETPRNRESDNAFNDMQIPGEGIIDFIENGINRLFGW